MHVHQGIGLTLGSVALIALFFATAIGLILLHRWGRQWIRYGTVALGVAVAGGLFQVAHFFEHGTQFAYWTMNPMEPPFMSPLGMHVMRGFQSLAPGIPNFGFEAMHLTGDSVFLFGAVGLLLYVRNDRRTRGAVQAAQTSAYLQGAHLVEHVMLMTTLVLTGRARGISTLFGMFPPTGVLSSYRIVWHFTINLVATSFMLRAFLTAYDAKKAEATAPAPTRRRRTEPLRPPARVAVID